MENNQKYALITGGTAGIGYELSKLFASDGYNLVLVARNEYELARTQTELQDEYKIQVHTISKDLMQREAPFEIYEEIKRQGITIDVLVNDAGQGVYGEFVDTDLDRELDIIQLNISAYVILTKKILQDMFIRGEGKILNVGSVAGEAPGPWQAVYHGTKAFVNSWSEAIRSELKDTNITVTVLLPGATDTDFFNKADMTESKIVQEGKLANPAKVAKDGYEALMSGDDKIVSGLKNKAMVAMGNVMPDTMVAENMKSQQEPANKK
ncbi:SDR family NAD(P)-dependent oxidoreductase [Desertivirga brevis]|uniref:SDR family NAD(P)-dependent oxidoreductase n=1 Tax=Desertivirga brevis TaxID=2810310 RepID=UPI001A958614|nr:SDR family oxidoreductase [Pedobacter sp. SYSU D00873]